MLLCASWKYHYETLFQNVWEVTSCRIAQASANPSFCVCVLIIHWSIGLAVRTMRQRLGQVLYNCWRWDLYMHAWGKMFSVAWRMMAYIIWNDLYIALKCFEQFHLYFSIFFKLEWCVELQLITEVLVAFLPFRVGSKLPSLMGEVGKTPCRQHYCESIWHRWWYFDIYLFSAHLWYAVCSLYISMIYMWIYDHDCS